METFKSCVLSFLFFAGTGTIYAREAVCPRAGQDPPCKGECGQFIDRNGDGICDEWAKEAQRLKAAAAEAAPKTKPAPAVPAPASVSKPENKAIPTPAAPAAGEKVVIKAEPQPQAEGFYEKLKKFSLIPLLAFTGFLVLLSVVLKARSEKYRAVHRDFWNWLLLLSFLACGLSGLALYFGDPGEFRSRLFKLHLWSGFLAFIAGLYHSLERYACMLPFRNRP